MTQLMVNLLGYVSIDLKDGSNLLKLFVKKPFSSNFELIDGRFRLVDNCSFAAKINFSNYSLQFEEVVISGKSNKNQENSQSSSHKQNVFAKEKTDNSVYSFKEKPEEEKLPVGSEINYFSPEEFDSIYNTLSFSTREEVLHEISQGPTINLHTSKDIPIKKFDFLNVASKKEQKETPFFDINKKYNDPMDDYESKYFYKNNFVENKPHHGFRHNCFSDKTLYDNEVDNKQISQPDLGSRKFRVNQFHEEDLCDPDIFTNTLAHKLKSYDRPISNIKNILNPNEEEDVPIFKRKLPAEESDFSNQILLDENKEHSNSKRMLKKICSICPEIICSICNSIVNTEDRCCPDGCLHSYCFGCLLEWSKFGDTCPLCRVGFSNIRRYNRDKLKEIIKIEPPQKRDDDDVMDANDQIIANAESDCYFCRSSENIDNLLICDNCNKKVCHTYCLSPSLEFVPQDEWYCDFCVEVYHVAPINPTSRISTRNPRLHQRTLTTFMRTIVAPEEQSEEVDTPVREHIQSPEPNRRRRTPTNRRGRSNRGNITPTNGRGRSNTSRNQTNRNQNQNLPETNQRNRTSREPSQRRTNQREPSRQRTSQRESSQRRTNQREPSRQRTSQREPSQRRTNQREQNRSRGEDEFVVNQRSRSTNRNNTTIRQGQIVPRRDRQIRNENTAYRSYTPTRDVTPTPYNSIRIPRNSYPNFD